MDESESGVETMEIEPESESANVVRSVMESGGHLVIRNGREQFVYGPDSAVPIKNPSPEVVALSRSGIRDSGGGWKSIVDTGALEAQIRDRRKTLSRKNSIS